MPAISLPARGVLLALGLTAALSACREEEAAEAPELRPVRTVIVQETVAGQTITLSGTVESQVEVDLAFRIGGRLVERPVQVGDTVEAGQPIGRLDPVDEQNALRAAEAALTAAAGQLSEVRANFERQRQLFERDFVSQAGLERAEQQLVSAQGAYDSAEAQASIARRRLADTELLADAPGVVVAVGAEAGEVVQPGRRIVQLARDEGKDAVFDVPTSVIAASPPDPEVSVSLGLSPGVVALGRVREIAPRADAATGTIRVRVGLIDPPAEMRLGSTITGRVHFGGVGGIELPASALTSADGAPAVWVVDPDSPRVMLRPVRVIRFNPATVSIEYGVEIGERVVTAGVQALRPGQEVRLLGDGS
ncbi:efflux RND transporter periplasmic adaptor subunit [Rhodobaculum claviforme]|uniref:Efflux transporter periplasmic adaptor subunit n=1 Tax=Rhodobaculum claviforme TaxID=1549854 RepID=A0A934TMI5_9RHOB|nr:efflux RND transporter periplasmic adaptor subunit [Rhodobaculum claviforme]MBK5928612.1 efflux transporter periplasmic adaptor subunit [Rhodobaculum claviforme]